MTLQKISIALLTVAFLSGCASKKTHTRSVRTVVVTPEEVVFLDVSQDKHIADLQKSNTYFNKKTLAYIRKFAPIAVQEMHAFKIPASITLAQGILESGNGVSELASKSNNHFGIKCHKGWTGERVYHDDDEKGECFRKYAHPETSYQDHSNFLTSRKRYAFLFELDADDYKGWAKGLRKAGYATDKKYPKKLIHLIKTYQLDAFDAVRKVKKSKRSKNSTQTTYYEVQAGDTLYSIAKKHRTTVAKLLKKNKLKNTALSIGQHLQIN